MKALEISVEHWLARGYGDPIARATLGQLQLRCDGRPLALLEDRLARSIRPFANLSAYDLAIWFAANWWRLRWEPEREETDWMMSHSLAAIGGGYVWPNITLLSDGEQMQLQVRPTHGREWEPVRYLENWDFGILIMDFEVAVDLFVEEVLARLAGCQITGTDLHILWQDLRSERTDSGLTSIRKLEALLGFDAGSAPAEVLDKLLLEAGKGGRTAIDEVAAGFGGNAGQVIDQMIESLAEHGTVLSSEQVIDLAGRRAEWDLSGLPWERASAAAHVARRIWNLDGTPIRDKKLVGLVEANESLLSDRFSAFVPLPAGRWATPARERWRVILKSPSRVGRRFQLCRLIGDGLIAPEGELLLPATAAKTSRQKFQRAFAQEFLCPFDALLERLGSSSPEDEDIEDAAAYFEVSPLVVRTTLVNKGILARDRLAS